MIQRDTPAKAENMALDRPCRLSVLELKWVSGAWRNHWHRVSLLLPLIRWRPSPMYVVADGLHLEHRGTYIQQRPKLSSSV